MSTLGQSGVSAVKWSAISTVARFGLQLIAQVVLARTLGPETYGIFAIGMLVLTFAGFFSSFGFSWSLVRRASVCEEDVRFAWTWQMLVGLVTTLTVYLLAPQLAEYFREPRSLPVIQWLSLACLLSAAAAPSTYLLQRDLNFRAAGLIQVASYAAGYVAVGIPMALLGWGATSLVAAWLVQLAVALAASYTLKPHALRPLFWYAEAMTAMGTGRAVFLTNVVNWLLGNLDRVLIGRLLNAHALGLYNVAYNLAVLPNSLLLGALQPTFMAAGARLQNEPERLGRAYFQIIASIFVLVFPAFVFLALIAPDLVHLLYGAQWSEAGWVLQILFLGMPFYVIFGLSTPVLWNTGHAYHESALQLPVLALGAAGFYLLAGQGIRTVAAVAAGLLVMRAMVIGITALRALRLSAAALLPHIGRGALLSALSALCVLAGQRATAPFDAPLLSLIASTVLPAGMLVALIMVRPQLLGDQTTAMVIRFFPCLGSVFDPEKIPMTLRDTVNEQHL